MNRIINILRYTLDIVIFFSLCMFFSRTILIYEKDKTLFMLGCIVVACHIAALVALHIERKNSKGV